MFQSILIQLCFLFKIPKITKNKKFSNKTIKAQNN